MYCLKLALQIDSILSITASHSGHLEFSANTELVRLSTSFKELSFDDVAQEARQAQDEEVRARLAISQLATCVRLYYINIFYLSVTLCQCSVFNSYYTLFEILIYYSQFMSAPFSSALYRMSGTRLCVCATL